MGYKPVVYLYHFFVYILVLSFNLGSRNRLHFGSYLELLKLLAICLLAFVYQAVNHAPTIQIS